MRNLIVALAVTGPLLAWPAQAGDPPASVHNPLLFNAASNDPLVDEAPGLGVNFSSSPTQNGVDTIEDAFGNQDGAVEAPTFIFGDGGTADNGNQVLGDGGETVDFIEWQTSEAVEIFGYHLILTNLDAFGRTVQLVRFLVDGAEEDFFDNDGASAASNEEVLDIPRPFATPLTGSTFRVELTRTTNGPRIWEIDALTESYCGNGTVEGAEECDDGNTVEDDGCDSTCTSDAICGDGVVTFPEQCDDGNTIAADGCEPDCSAICGDGIAAGGEDCDDGNTLECDGCSNGCFVESCCGNGVVDPPEQCDDGNTIDDDECDNTCQSAATTAPLAGQIKLKVGLRFDKVLKDAISLGIKGMTLPEGFSASGASVAVDVGGTILDAPLDEKGRYKSADKRDRLKLKQSRRDGAWTLKLKRKKNDFAVTFADEGLADEDNKEGKSADVGISVAADGVEHVTNHGVSYRSKAGKKGSAKTAR